MGYIIPKGKILEDKLQSDIVKDSGNTYIIEAGIGTPATISSWAITKIDSDGRVSYPIREETGEPTYGFWFLPSEATNYSYSYEAEDIS